jgi:hypothetical protein
MMEQDSHAALSSRLIVQNQRIFCKGSEDAPHLIDHSAGHLCAVCGKQLKTVGSWVVVYKQNMASDS